MKLVAWNILHGGGTKRTPEIALRLAELSPDVVVLTEFRRTTGGQIAGVLLDRGLCHQCWTDPEPGRNGVFVASRTPIELGDPAPDPTFRNRWLDVRLTDANTWLTAIHAPDTHRSNAEGVQRQASFWQYLVTLAESRKQGRMLIAGDFNTGRHRLDESGETFTGSWFLGRLSTLGFRDAYRLIEPSKRGKTWSSHTGSGFRIDAIWASSELRTTVKNVWHDLAAMEARTSDHAPVVAEFGGVFQGVFEVAKGGNSKNPAKIGLRALAGTKVVR